MLIHLSQFIVLPREFLVKQQMWHRHLSKFYCSTVFSDISIEKRIKAFAEMDLRLPQRAYPIVSPPYLTESNTKSILQFVSTHKIPNNVRILHALAHIEYNAFMSYADTVIRFRQQTQPYQIQFQSDVRAVALEQGHHFSLLKNRLQALGFHYGSIPVIPKLSLAIQQSNNSLLERIALISLVHQGRGMKAVEKLLGQLHKEKDTQSVDIVKIIRNDESRHFMIGWKWFLRICMLKNIDPGEKIAQLNAKYRTDMRLPDQPQAKE